MKARTAKTGVHPLLEAIEEPSLELEDEYGRALTQTGHRDEAVHIPADLRAISADDGRMGGTQRGDSTAIARGCAAFWQGRGHQPQTGFRAGFHFGARAAA